MVSDNLKKTVNKKTKQRKGKQKIRKVKYWDKEIEKGW